MKILLFGGTTEGREILKSGLPLIYSAATEYGATLAFETIATDDAAAEIFSGRMDAAAMEKFFTEREIVGVIDATHPYAVEASENIRFSCERAGLPCIRVIRARAGTDREEAAAEVADAREAAALLNGERWRGEKVLLTAGSRDLASFMKVEDYKKRLYIRVLPVGEVILACEKAGFDARHIIAMQGPFSKAMNKAMLEMTEARVLVTKDSGAAGGLREKLEAARECGVDTILIRRPEESGVTVAEAVEWAHEILRAASGKSPPFALFVRLDGLRAVVVGGGKVAGRRVSALLECGARVRAISPEFIPEFGAALRESGNFCQRLERIQRSYREGDLEGAVLAVVATNDRGVNRQAGEEARKRNIPVSVADAPDECTFFFPATAAFGSVVAAVSTGGRSPSLCRRLTDRLRKVWAGWVAEETAKLN